MLIGATSPIVTNQGWLYDILRWAGVSDPTAGHFQDVVVVPLSIVVIVLVAVLIGRFGNRVIRRWIGAAAAKAVARADSPRAAARALTLTSLLGNVWRGVVGVIAFFVILGTIGLNLTPFLAGATVIGAALAFGAQTMVRDLLAGFLLTVEGQFDIGDTIMVGDTTGTVEDLTLRVTRLRADDGTIWYVPNGEIRKLANSSRGWAQATVEVPVPVAADIDAVLGAIRAAVDDVARDPRTAPLLLEPPRLWGVVATAVDSFTCKVSVRTSTTERDHLARVLREEIARRLQEVGAFTTPAPAPAAAPADETPRSPDGARRQVGVTARPRRLGPGLDRARAAAGLRWRHVTAGLRTLPDVVILGTQRGGTTSLFDWLAVHPSVTPSTTKEVHYFDRFYANGDRWYRSHFPLKVSSRLSMEATPYLLFYPLAPERVAADLPPSTRFIVLLRDPVQRAVSQYWHSRRLRAEDQPLGVALEREDERLAGQEQVVLAGGDSFAYRNFSYQARGRYAEQLRRWFALIERDRFLVMESEEICGPSEAGRVLAWLGLSARDVPFPASNDAPRDRPEDPAVLDELARYFAPYDEDLFDLLGTRLWGR